MRPSPERIEILLPVWGARHIRDCLDYCLPALLAPGNLPALATMAPCTLVLLAPVRDAAAIKADPVWQRVAEHAALRVEPIDDLLSDSSSTVLTLAYALAIRQAGAAAVNTCFIALVADYVLADGALSHVANRIFAGASGVVAGNFHVAREAILPCLEARRAEGALTVRPRDLVALSLARLHPETLAATVGVSRHTDRSVNRLFWRVDAGCLVGRYYLMHMIALRPETADFVIGASSDYSFIPELCPSGAVVAMTDSDDYFVAELKPRRAHAEIGEPVDLDPAPVADAIGAWATREHRANCRHVVVFHADEPPAALADVVERSNAFVARVEALTLAPPLPSRHHPVWRRALDRHIATAAAAQDAARLATITGDGSLTAATRFSRVSGLREALLGTTPEVRAWHPRWADLRKIRQCVEAMGAVPSMAVIGDVPARVGTWLGGVARAAGAQHLAFLPAGAIAAGDGASHFDACLVLLAAPSRGALTGILRPLAPMLDAHARVVVVIGSVFSDGVESVPRRVLNEAETAGGGQFALEAVEQLAYGRARAAIQQTMMRHARASARPGRRPGLISLAAAGMLATASALVNRRLAARPSAGSRHSSSVFLTFRRIADPVPGRSPSRRRDFPAKGGAGGPIEGRSSAAPMTVLAGDVR